MERHALLRLLAADGWKQELTEVLKRQRPTVPQRHLAKDQRLRRVPQSLVQVPHHEFVPGMGLSTTLRDVTETAKALTWRRQRSFAIPLTDADTALMHQAVFEALRQGDGDVGPKLRAMLLKRMLGAVLFHGKQVAPRWIALANRRF